jgi:hypothetical protein
VRGCGPRTRAGSSAGSSSVTARGARVPTSGRRGPPPRRPPPTHCLRLRVLRPSKLWLSSLHQTKFSRGEERAGARERKLHGVGPNCETKAGPQFGPTLCNPRAGARRSAVAAASTSPPAACTPRCGRGRSAVDSKTLICAATSWVNPKAALRANFVCTRILAQTHTYLPHFGESMPRQWQQDHRVDP